MLLLPNIRRSEFFENNGSEHLYKMKSDKDRFNLYFWSIYRKCIYILDHHCFFLGRCVGRLWCIISSSYWEKYYIQSCLVMQNNILQRILSLQRIYTFSSQGQSQVLYNLLLLCIIWHWIRADAHFKGCHYNDISNHCYNITKHHNDIANHRNDKTNHRNDKWSLKLRHELRKQWVPGWNINEEKEKFKIKHII